MSVSATLDFVAHFFDAHNQKPKSNKVKKITFQIYSGAARKHTF